MAWDNVHAHDYGWTGQIQVRQGGQPLNIASYTTRQYLLIPPSGVANKKTLSATLVSDGSDGLLTHTFVQGEIDEVGDWLCAVRLIKSATELTSDYFTFLADERVDQ